MQLPPGGAPEPPLELVVTHVQSFMLTPAASSVAFLNSWNETHSETQIDPEI